MKLLIQAVFNLNSYVSAYPETAIGEFGSLFLISDYHCFRQLFPAKLIIIRKFYARLHIAGMDYHATAVINCCMEEFIFTICRSINNDISC